MNFRSEVVYSLRMITCNILFLFRIQKLSFAEYRSKKVNSFSLKVKFFIYGILCPP